MKIVSQSQQEHKALFAPRQLNQWRNDGVAAASSDGGPTGGRGPPTVLEFLVINFSVCLVLLSHCYIIIYRIVWFQVQPLMVVFQ